MGGEVNNKVIGELVRAYIAARNLNQALSPKEAAGFLITQFGVMGSINAINNVEAARVPGFWADVLSYLMNASK